MFDLYFSDLTTAAQVRFLAACGLNNAAEGNYDVLPIVSPSVQKRRRGGRINGLQNGLSS